MDQNFNNNDLNNLNTANKEMGNNQPLNNNVYTQPQQVNPNIGQQPVEQSNTQIQQNVQPAPSFQQPIMQDPMSQPTNTFEGGNSNDESLNSKPSKKKNLGLIIGIVVVIVVVLLTIIFGENIINKNDNNVNNEKSDVSEDTKNETSKAKSLVVYLSNLKITLGQTTMDEIIKNTNLKIIKDETNKDTGYTSDGNRKNTIEYDKRKIVLSDDVNVIVITSYFEKTNIVGAISTLRNGQVDDPAFDNSKDTTLSFEDDVIGKRMNIGDIFTKDEFYDDLDVGYCYGYTDTLYCPQTKNYSDDMFIYYFDDNLKIVNMKATLMSYYE